MGNCAVSVCLLLCGESCYLSLYGKTNWIDLDLRLIVEHCDGLLIAFYDQMKSKPMHAAHSVWFSMYYLLCGPFKPVKLHIFFWWQILQQTVGRNWYTCCLQFSKTHFCLNHKSVATIWRQFHMLYLSVSANRALINHHRQQKMAVWSSFKRLFPFILSTCCLAVLSVSPPGVQCLLESRWQWWSEKVRYDMAVMEKEHK